MSKRREEKKTLHGDKNSARILNRADFKREMKNYIHPSDAWRVRRKPWNKPCESLLRHHAIKYAKCLRTRKIWVHLTWYLGRSINSIRLRSKSFLFPIIQRIFRDPFSIFIMFSLSGYSGKHFTMFQVNLQILSCDIFLGAPASIANQAIQSRIPRLVAHTVTTRCERIAQQFSIVYTKREAANYG